MTELIEFDPVDRIATGALGSPGQRTFLIQAEKGPAELTVLLEKQQVAALSEHLFRMLGELDPVASGVPDEALSGIGEVADLEDPAEPLFSARLIRVGFDAGRELVLLELYEQEPEELEELGDLDAPELLEEEPPGRVARLFFDLEQARAVATRGAQAVAAGRPTCRMCWLPIDPEGHQCPAMN